MKLQRYFLWSMIDDWTYSESVPQTRHCWVTSTDSCSWTELTLSVMHVVNLGIVKSLLIFDEHHLSSQFCSFLRKPNSDFYICPKIFSINYYTIKGNRHFSSINCCRSPEKQKLCFATLKPQYNVIRLNWRDRLS